MKFMSDNTSNRQFLHQLILERSSVLTVGLDTDVQKLPPIVNGDMLAFNKAIIDATRDLCIAYKINFAFYEAIGMAGWRIMEETIAYIGDQHLIIADAKRGDIGNTSAMYARAVFDHLGCDAITVNPYMGKDCVTPFLRDDKWVILLALTSNAGSADFQKQKLDSGELLYQSVMKKTAGWGNANNTMYVLGATHPDEIATCRRMYPDHFFLIPGVGAQGGDLEAILDVGLNQYGGLLINASRSILYAGTEADFAVKAREEALKLQGIMKNKMQFALSKN